MDCNLELGLSPSSTSISSTASTISMGSVNGDNPKKQEQQRTIFYNGTICVCDVTDVQAKSIIQLASRKTIQEICTSTTITPTLQSQQLCTQTQNGLSAMKKSLRQFLEKRKHRIQATSPYRL
ncbi:protein TIFY 5A [Spinacia oleracea]|uniref:Protein TIFY n=1 Tax=Spinacia oleracea TaxID=3562 RepID=A0A9R0I314_SPIOL|nr:protein TIFY 5A-like [Spinacia oleracea]